MPDIAITDASYLVQTSPFCRHAEDRSLAKYRKGPESRTGDLHFFTPILRQLLHGVYHVSIPLDKLSVVISESEKAHRLRVGVWCFPCQHCFNCFGIRSDPVFIYNATQNLNESLRISHLESLPFRTACFMK